MNEISEQPSFEGLSPLAVACQTCDLPMATLLLELGADPTEKNAAGKPPIVALFGQQILLHGPKSLYRDRLAAQMLDFGEPDANAVNLDGKTAMDYAVERDNAPLVKLLLPYMA